MPQIEKTGKENRQKQVRAHQNNQKLLKNFQDCKRKVNAASPTGVRLRLPQTKMRDAGTQDASDENVSLIQRSTGWVRNEELLDGFSLLQGNVVSINRQDVRIRNTEDPEGSAGEPGPSSNRRRPKQVFLAMPRS